MNKSFGDAATRVLVVDDEPHIAAAVSYLLVKEGMQVQTAQNADQALKQLETYTPDVLVLDVMMPGMDGYTLAKTIHAQQLCPEARIVFLTAKGAERDRAQGYAAGGEYYITKPFDNQEFVETVKEIVAFEL